MGVEEEGKVGVSSGNWPGIEENGLAVLIMLLVFLVEETRTVCARRGTSGSAKRTVDVEDWRLRVLALLMDVARWRFPGRGGKLYVLGGEKVVSTGWDRNGLREFGRSWLVAVGVVDETSDVSTRGAGGADGNGQAPGRDAVGAVAVKGFEEFGGPLLIVETGGRAKARELRSSNALVFPIQGRRECGCKGKASGGEAAGGVSAQVLWSSDREGNLLIASDLSASASFPKPCCDCCHGWSHG